MLQIKVVDDWISYKSVCGYTYKSLLGMEQGDSVDWYVSNIILYRNGLSHFSTVRSTFSEHCIRENGSTRAMCSQDFPLGVLVSFGTLQAAGSSLLSVVVSAGSFAHFCGPFSFTIRSSSAGLYSSARGYVFSLPSFFFSLVALAVRPFRFWKVNAAVLVSATLAWVPCCPLVLILKF